VCSSDLYANATNARVVAALADLNFTGKTFAADGGSASSLATGVAQCASYIFQATWLRPEFILAAPDAYIAIVGVGASDGRPVSLLNGSGNNNIGAANVAGLSGQIFGLPIIVDPQLASGTASLANSAAVISMESAGAPFRVSDGDITTLTAGVSVYGYMAVAVVREGVVVKLDLID